MLVFVLFLKWKLNIVRNELTLISTREVKEHFFKCFCLGFADGRQTRRNMGISKGLGGFMTNHCNCNYMLVQTGSLGYRQGLWKEKWGFDQEKFK